MTDWEPFMRRREDKKGREVVFGIIFFLFYIFLVVLILWLTNKK